MTVGVIRPAVAADAQSLAVLGAHTWLNTYATQGIRPSVARYVLEHMTPQTFLHQMRQPDTIVLVAAARDGHLIGYSIAEIRKYCDWSSGTGTHLERLYVHDSFLGKGVGYGLLASNRLESMRRTGNGALWLTVNAHNRRARAFYQRQGFADIGVTQFDLYGEKHENRVLHSCAGE